MHCVGEVGGASEGDGVEVVARSGAVEYRVQDTQENAAKKDIKRNERRQQHVTLEHITMEQHKSLSGVLQTQYLL